MTEDNMMKHRDVGFMLLGGTIAICVASLTIAFTENRASGFVGAAMTAVLAWSLASALRARTPQ